MHPASDHLRGVVTEPSSAVSTASSGRLCLSRSVDVSDFQGKTVLGETAEFRPCLCADASGAWLAWRGLEDQSINYLTSTDGVKWRTQERVEAATFHDARAPASWNGRLVWCWTG
jgi:hypothetical protein